MTFPEEESYNAAVMDDPPPHTEPDPSTKTPVDTPYAAVAQPRTPPDPEVHFLTYARNGFGELSRIAMLWEVRHRWPTGSRFAHNLYHHKCCLILRGPPGTDPSILLSKEGVMKDACGA